jgi:hypothetical protein
MPAGAVFASQTTGIVFVKISGGIPIAIHACRKNHTNHIYFIYYMP